MKRLNFKKILKWTGIVAGIGIALLLIANALFVWGTGSRLEKRLAALRAAGLPIRTADLAREPIPPERNDETYLRRAGDDLKAIEKELDAMYPRVGYPPKPPTPAEQEKLEKLFAAYPKVWPLIEQAADAPDHDPQLDTSLPRQRFLESYMDAVARHRPLYRVLRARSALLLAKGHPDEAIAAQLELLRLTRLWRSEPMLLGFLVTAVGEYTAVEVINQALQAGPVTPATRQAIEAELARHDSMEGYARALQTERAFSLDMAREIPAGRYWPLHGFVNDLMLRLIDLCDRYVADSSRPYLEVLRESKAAAAAPAGLIPNPYSSLATLLEPSFRSALEAGDRVRAMVRSLRVLNAMQARPAAADGQAPPLGDLGLPAEATIDPFNGEPLRVAKRSRGWMVYSVGANGVDDDGHLEKAVDVGVGPPAEEAPKTP